MFKNRQALLPVFVIIAFVFQLATPVVAWAEDETPPPEPQPAAEVASEPEVPDAAQEPAAEAAPAEALVEEPTAAEILAQVPEGTGVLVLDETGEPEPLTTQQAAETIITSDPVWCPVGISDPLDSTCTGSQASFSALLTFLGLNPSYAGAGTIFFYSATPMVYSLDDVRISPTTPGAGNLTDLTIDGMGHQFRVPVEITSWAYDVSVANLDMDLSTYGNPAAGLRVETTGAISVDDVHVTGSGGGAYLDNDQGSAGIAIQDSTFNDNAWTGLDARSTEDITLQNVDAIGNEYGAYLDASAGSGNITVSTGGGSADFSGNASAGLTARTADGDISVSGVTADSSTAADSYGAGLTSTGGGSVTVDTSSFQGNGGKGLWIEASGSVLVHGATASGNGSHGLYVNNLDACVPLPLNLTIDAGTFDANGGYGFYARLGPAGTLFLPGINYFGVNGLGDYMEDLSPCPICEDKHEGKPYNVIHVPETDGDPVPLDCENYAGTVLILPNGDRVTLVCPVSGEATLESLPGGGLPGPLPPARTFISGVDVGLTDGGAAVQALTEGGYITLVFPIPEDWEEASLAVLYWDPTADDGAGGWVELPPYALRPDGTPMIHRLHPDADPDDLMYIRGGVRVLTEFVKVSVTFPGIFVLAAR
jgi:hypothetical protein